MSKKDRELDTSKHVVKDEVNFNFSWDEVFIDKSGMITDGAFQENEDMVKEGPNLYKYFLEKHKLTNYGLEVNERDILGFQIDRDYNYDEPDDYDVYLVRLETQQEVDQRIRTRQKQIASAKKAAATKAKKAKELEEKKKEKEYQDYLKLKKRYEE